ncbi:hypothetical protein K488DRAFT_70125 [Vararia minispora EC-137]|uniref:Uncharacterized protein n=1 Tax=Vararia minispora EC-137 TaxID=1314806 RepID=A0ACB8QNC5_9AGAM|nr:hypothetical protein K488DRAFT_70125 [Vararia minispora EC-137]
MVHLWSLLTVSRRRTGTPTSRAANEGAGRFKWSTSADLKSRLGFLMRRSRVMQRRPPRARRESAAEEGTEDVLDIRRATIDIGGPDTDRRSMFSMGIKNPDPVWCAGVERATLDHSPGARIETIGVGEGGSGREGERGDSAATYDLTSAAVLYLALPLDLVVCAPCPHDPLPDFPSRIPVRAQNTPESPCRMDKQTAPTAGNLMSLVSLLADVVSPPAQGDPLLPGVRSSLGTRSMYRAAMRHSVDPSAIHRACKALYLVFEDGNLARATGEGAALF